MARDGSLPRTGRLRADRIALCAVALALVLAFVAATSAHAAVLPAFALH